MLFLNSLRDLFKQSIPEMVVKYSTEAQKYETTESKRAGDRYVAAKMKTDNFNNYKSFTYTALLKAGFTDKEAKEYSFDKTKIPFNRRDAAVSAQREEIIEKYVEQNDYYRALYGLPSLEDYEQVWLDKRVYDDNHITPCAVHEIKHEDLISLESLGELDEIRERYPNKKYLKYLGSKRIDIVTSRLADNFEIIFFPRIQGQDNYYKNFILTYEQCREYFLSVIYNRYYGNKYNYYDNFIAFNILIMTINRLIPDMLLRFKEREFYDIDTMRVFLESYGIKYDSSFQMHQLRLVCKNLNILLQSKSTNSVLVDVVDLLGYANCNVMKYYMVKQHRLDNDGKPIFPYKTITDDNGEQKQVLDEENMYDFYFVNTDINNFNINSVLHDRHKHYSYKEVTGSDDYWVEDEKLKEKLIKSSFNYIETKYIDIDVVFRLQQILFETCYLTRLVLDDPRTKNIMITMNKISTHDISIFDAFVLLICLMCKYNHMEPDLLSTPSKVLYISGFNNEVDIEAIRSDIKNSSVLDQKLLTYITKDILTSVKSINEKYIKIRELESLLVRRMNECESIDVYNAYDKLYKTLLITKLNNDIYKMKDGTVPLQFTDYIRDRNDVLYEYLETKTDDESIIKAIDYITGIISKYFDSTKHLNNIKLMNDTQLSAIMKLLRFFKSYTVHMKQANMVILLDSRYFNSIIWLSKVTFGNKNGMDIIIPDKSMLDLIKASIYSEKENMHTEDTEPLKDENIFLSDGIAQDRTHIDFKEFCNLDMKINETDTIRDYIKNVVSSDISLKSRTTFDDNTKELENLRPISIANVVDKAFNSISNENQRDNIVLTDGIHNNISKPNINSNLNFRDSCVIIRPE